MFLQSILESLAARVGLKHDSAKFWCTYQRVRSQKQHVRTRHKQVYLRCASKFDAWLFGMALSLLVIGLFTFAVFLALAVFCIFITFFTHKASTRSTIFEFFVNSILFPNYCQPHLAVLKSCQIRRADLI